MGKIGRNTKRKKKIESLKSCEKLYKAKKIRGEHVQKWEGTMGKIGRNTKRNLGVVNGKTRMGHLPQPVWLHHQGPEPTAAMAKRDYLGESALALRLSGWMIATSHGDAS